MKSKRATQLHLLLAVGLTSANTYPPPGDTLRSYR